MNIKKRMRREAKIKENYEEFSDKCNRKIRIRNYE